MIGYAEREWGSGLMGRKKKVKKKNNWRESPFHYLQRMAKKHNIYVFSFNDQIDFIDKNNGRVVCTWHASKKPWFAFNEYTGPGRPIDALRALVAPYDL